MLQFLFLAVAYAELNMEKYKLGYEMRKKCMTEKKVKIGAMCPKGDECMCGSHCVEFLPGFKKACHTCEDLGEDKEGCTAEDLGGKMGCFFSEEKVNGVNCLSVFDKDDDKKAVVFQTKEGCDDTKCPRSDVKEEQLKMCAMNKCFGKGACLMLEDKPYYTCDISEKNTMESCKKVGYNCMGAKETENVVEGTCEAKIEDLQPRCKDIKNEALCLKEGFNPISKKGICLWKPKGEMTDMEKKMMMCMKKENVKLGMECKGDECKCKMVCMEGKCAKCESIKDEDKCESIDHCKYVKTGKGNMCLTEDDVLDKDDSYKCVAEIKGLQGKCDAGKDKESCMKVRSSPLSTKQICKWMKEMTEDEKKQMMCMEKEQIKMMDACKDKCGCMLACIDEKCMRCEAIENMDACGKYPTCVVVGRDDERSCVTKDPEDVKKGGRCLPAKVEGFAPKCQVAKDKEACHKITASLFSKVQICQWHEKDEMTEEEKKQMECAKKEGMKMGDKCEGECKCGFACFGNTCQRCEKLDGQAACDKFKMCKYVKALGEEKAQCITADTTVDDPCAGNDTKKACKKLKAKSCKYDKKEKKCMFSKPVPSKKTCKKLTKEGEEKCKGFGCSWEGRKKKKCAFKNN